MIWFDLTILVVIALSALISLLRGFVREALSLIGWIGAFFVAKHFYQPLAALLVNSIENAVLRESVAWVSLFFATLLMTGLINYVISKAVLRAGLSGTDRILGMVFGACRGIFVAVLLVLAMLFFTDFHKDAWWKQSRLIPHLQLLGEWFANHIDKDLYKSFNLTHVVSCDTKESVCVE